MSISSASLLRTSGAGPAPVSLAQRLSVARQFSLTLAAPLSAEDAGVQSLPECAPAKWHLAHTTWFFEQFVLAQEAGYRPFRPDWLPLFNDGYPGAGPSVAPGQRGLLGRPALAEILEYRAHVDYQIGHRFREDSLDPQARRHLILGLHNEQWHQELMLAGIKHALWSHPLQPAYRPGLADGPAAPAVNNEWLAMAAGWVDVGAPAWPDNPLFACDHESPRQRLWLPPHELARRPVTNQEFHTFIADGGYRDARHWMRQGWELRQADGWERPLYWDRKLEQEYTLGGWRALDPEAPVCHLSWFEADAFARWAGARLPGEVEWEAAATGQPVQGRFAEDGVLHPLAAQAGTDAEAPLQLFGDVWEWTSSTLAPYPGYRPTPGAIGEYNRAWMSGRQVARGGSCISPRGLVRASYRLGLTPATRWQFTGLRLARDAGA